jgi:hypothetical protein
MAGEIGNVRRISFGYDKIGRPIWKPWLTISKVNIKMNLKKSACDNVDWFILAHDKTSGELLRSRQ